MLMIKQIAWNTFKNTGNIDVFMELKNLEKNMKVKEDEINKNKWDNNCRKDGIRF